MAIEEHPILFSAAMVRAILDGSKTQTRRILSPQPEYVWGWGVPNSDPEHFCAHVRYPGQRQPDPWVRCSYGVPPNRGKPGSRLWVRETWAEDGCGYTYRATNETWPHHWAPSIFMPRTACRLLLEIISIKVEQLQNISMYDAMDEGVGRPRYDQFAQGSHLVGAFRDLWNEINAKHGYGWDVNPWVWAITFKRLIESS